jgi:hypothetical protein
MVDEAMDMQMGIDDALDRAGGEMDELGDDHIGDGPLIELAPLADPGLDAALHLPHGFADGLAQGVEAFP